jgi:2,5-diketo-D-gluconate reductase B
MMRWPWQAWRRRDRPAIVPTIEANGARIPAIGLGTSGLLGENCAQMVEQALRLGYRHVDTAQMYLNEREVGDGLRASGVARADVFVTTKVLPQRMAPGDLERSAEESLAKLGLSEVDLLLLHWPSLDIPLADTMGAMCRVKREGLTRHIGVSNFPLALLEQALSFATEPLVTDQVEWHPFLDQAKVLAGCRRNGLAVTAYAPVAQGKVFGDEVLRGIGARHGKSAGQVSLRYLLQRGAIVIPKSARPEGLAENFAIFDFELSPAETAEIDKLAHPRGRIVGGPDTLAWD